MQADLDEFVNNYRVRLWELFATNGMPAKKADRNRLGKEARQYAISKLRSDQTWITDDLKLWNKFFPDHVTGKTKRPPSVLESRGQLIHVRMANVMLTLVAEYKRSAIEKIKAVPETSVKEPVPASDTNSDGVSGVKELFDTLAQVNGYNPFFMPRDGLLGIITGRHDSSFAGRRAVYLKDEGWQFDKVDNGWLVTPVKPNALPADVVEKVKTLDADTRQALIELLSEL